MPEIAEVESVARVLDKNYAGKTLLNTRLYTQTHSKGLPRNISKDFEKINGLNLERFYRIGKHIVAKFSNDNFLVTHLMMSGVFVINATNQRNLYVEFAFKDAPNLFYFDPRRFSKMIVCGKNDLQLLHKGIDALDPDLTPQKLSNLLSKSSLEVKIFLLEKQDQIVGIGNIYACEILWHAKISPFIKCNQLNSKQIERLCNSISFILQRAVKLGGSTLGDKGYFLPDGTFGSCQNFHAVYDKENRFCINNCGHFIKRVVQKNRATFYCSVCQC